MAHPRTATSPLIVVDLRTGDRPVTDDDLARIDRLNPKKVTDGGWRLKASGRRPHASILIVTPDGERFAILADFLPGGHPSEAVATYLSPHLSALTDPPLTFRTA